MPWARSIADTDDTPACKAFVDAGKKQNGAFPSPSPFAQGYYVDMKATLLRLEAVTGDTSDSGAALGEALSKLSFDSPTG